MSFGEENTHQRALHTKCAGRLFFSIRREAWKMEAHTCGGVGQFFGFTIVRCIVDISFEAGEEKFNYRVGAVILNDGKLLAMRDELSPYYYLPGGRVKLGETAEQAVVREVYEELHVTAEIVRPLWLNQAFFKEEVDGLRYHELCICFLLDISNIGLLSNCDGFFLMEGERRNRFEWLRFERLKDEHFYPTFLKEAIFNLPETFTLRTEQEQAEARCSANPRR